MQVRPYMDPDAIKCSAYFNFIAIILFLIQAKTFTLCKIILILSYTSLFVVTINFSANSCIHHELSNINTMLLVEDLPQGKESVQFYLKQFLLS